MCETDVTLQEHPGLESQTHNKVHVVPGNNQVDQQANGHRKGGASWRAGLLTMLALLGLHIFVMRRRRIRRSQLWAARHRALSQAIIALSHGIGGVLALLLGRMWAEADVLFHDVLTPIAVVACCGAGLLYPVDRSRHKGVARWCDFTLALSGWLLVACIANMHHTDNTWLGALLGQVASPLTALPLWAQVVLTLLATLALLFLAELVAALACSLACSGMEAAAALVAVLGGISLIVAYVLALRKIWKPAPYAPPDRPRKPKDPKVVMKTMMILSAVAIGFILLMALLYR